MEDSSGFFKKLNNEIVRAENFVYSPTAELLREQKDSYQYPVDGWYWFDSFDQAVQFFATPEPSTNYFEVVPEGFNLATNPSDEAEFNKLITLLQLSLSAGAAQPTDLIKIKDKDGFVHELTAQRFLQIMVGYGFFCYGLRNL